MAAFARIAFLAALAAPLWFLGSGPALAAGGDMPQLVRDIGVSLLAAGVLAVLFVRLHLPNIAAFLVAGVVVGPLLLAQVTDPANIDTIAQLGFIFLLFVIGLEIDIKKILASGKPIIVTGFLQFPISVVFGMAAVKLLLLFGIGAALIADYPYALLYLGILMGMSSTLLVVKLFQEHFELDTEPGRISLGLLIFQDIWAIIVILIQPNFSNPQLVPILMSFLGIGILIAVSVPLSRYIAARGFRWIAKTPELILVAAISWCFIVVFLGLNLDTLTKSLFGFDLHMAVGSGMAALIAGATIANLPFATEIVTKVNAIKDFFITLFFIGLGMSIPMPEGWDVLILAVALAFLAILTRQLIFFPLLYFAGCDQRNAQVSSVKLAQISEFGLVIAFLALQYDHISPNLSSAIIFAFVLTALITPALYNNAYRIHRIMAPSLTMLGFRAPPDQEAEEDQSYVIAFLGFHRVASSLLYDLSVARPDILGKVLVVDFNVQIHDKIAAQGVTVKYGDLSNEETLHHAGIDRAKIILCTIPDDILRGVTNANLVHTVRHINPDATIIANALELRDVDAIYQAGADFVYMGSNEISRGIMEIIEKALSDGLPAHRAQCDLARHQRREVF